MKVSVRDVLMAPVLVVVGLVKGVTFALRVAPPLIIIPLVILGILFPWLFRIYAFVIFCLACWGLWALGKHIDWDEILGK